MKQIVKQKTMASLYLSKLELFSSVLDMKLIFKARWQKAVWMTFLDTA